MRIKKISVLIIGGILIAATVLLMYLIPHATYYKYDDCGPFCKPCHRWMLPV